MSHVVHPRKKFRFDARVEYVTEELDHNGSLFFMFNIKVVADPEGIDHGMDSIQWSVIKSEDEFHQTHKSLKTKYGLLKSFQFRNPSAIGNNMFHLTHPTKPRREKKDEFLLAVLSLDPIPDEVSAFLCLDNAFYFAKTATEENQHRSSIHSSALSIDTSHNTINKRNHGNAVTTVGSPVGAFSPQRTERASSSKRWYLDAGLIVSFIVLALGAALLSQLASSVGNATGISHKDSIGIVNLVDFWNTLFVLHSPCLVITLCSDAAVRGHRPVRARPAAHVEGAHGGGGGHGSGVLVRTQGYRVGPR